MTDFSFKVIFPCEQILFHIYLIFVYLIFQICSHGKESLDELKSQASREICVMLIERIESLNDLGLYNLWMKPDGYEWYNAATILGYTCDDWDLIKKYYKKIILVYGIIRDA